MTSNDRDVIQFAARMVAQARDVFPRYASTSAPSGTAHLHQLVAAFGCRVLAFPFRSGAVGMELPVVNGITPILVDSRSPRTDRTFAVRHGLGHIIAGDTGPVFLTETDYMSPAERTADLFALADCVPGWWVGQVRDRVRSWKKASVEVRAAITDYAGGWPADRLADRTNLRILLYREEGV